MPGKRNAGISATYLDGQQSIGVCERSLLARNSLLNDLTHVLHRPAEVTAFAGAYGDAKTKFVVTKKGRVNAGCHGPDESGIYEEGVEMDRFEMDECTIFLPDGSIAYGWGHFVAAANDACEGCGGNFSMQCHGFLAVD